MKNMLFTHFIPIGIILIGIYFSFWTSILKDESRNDIKPYSFARAQLMWWTLIISAAFSAYYGENHVMILLNDNNSCLILLGISIGTVTASRVIDNNEIINQTPRHQDKNRGLNFLTDIISDNNGISVHRFQALIFNLIFGGIFINEFLTTGTFAQFGTTELTLMGISSATFVGLKFNENKDGNNKSAAPDSQNPPPPPAAATGSQNPSTATQDPV